MSRISQPARAKAFGSPGDITYLRHIPTPWMKPGTNKHLYVHAHVLIADLLLHCFAHAVRPAWTPRRVDSYAPRKVRGSTNWSLHSWGLAFDFFVTPPGVKPPGGVWTPDNPVTPEFAQAFTSHGFTWGNEWTRKDLPHIEWSGGVPLSRR